MNLQSWQQHLMTTARRGVNGASSFSKNYDVDRLKVYRDNYSRGLASFLRITYAQTYWLLGQGNFLRYANEFANTTHLLANDIDGYGRDFADHLAQRLGPAHSYVADVARVDWAIQQSYYANNRAAFDYTKFSQLACRDYASVRFVLADDLTLLRSCWPLKQIWEAYGQQQAVPPIKKARTPQYYLVERAKLSVSVSELSANKTELFNNLYRRLSLADLFNTESDNSDIEELIKAFFAQS